MLKSHIGHTVAPVECTNEEFVELAKDKLLPCVWKLSFSCLRLSVTECIMTKEQITGFEKNLVRHYYFNISKIIVKIVKISLWSCTYPTSHSARRCLFENPFVER